MVGEGAADSMADGTVEPTEGGMVGSTAKAFTTVIMSHTTNLDMSIAILLISMEG